MAIHTVNWEEAFPQPCRQGVVSIGNFDGVHLGHASLLRQTHDSALALGSPSVALTFYPHPLEVLHPGMEVARLTTPPQRAELLMQSGATEVLVLQVTPSMLALSADAFFTEVLLDRLAVRGLVEGTSFGFGHNREGDITRLQALCQQASIPLTVVPPTLIDDEVVSSSRIRRALQDGDIPTATRLLGRPYRLEGEVALGEQRGRTLGFPTANLTGVKTVLPAEGVYAVRVHHAGQTWPGAANIGNNPTFGEQKRKIEVHLIDFQGDLYGQRLCILFLARLREVIPFASVAQLTDQLHHDIATARQVATQMP